jgi:ketosteroid isomerase-like protein
MKRVLFILGFSLITGASICGQHPSSAPIPVGQPEPATKTEQPLTKAEREVRKLEREWLDAYEKHDSLTMDRILADDFKLSFSNGSSQSKADILAQLKTGRESGQPAPKFSTKDVQSRLEGDTVILAGRLTQQGARGTMQMSYTDTYAWRDGRWQDVDSKLKRIQP